MRVNYIFDKFYPGLRIRSDSALDPDPFPSKRAWTQTSTRIQFPIHAYIHLRIWLPVSHSFHCLYLYKHPQAELQFKMSQASFVDRAYNRNSMFLNVWPSLIVNVFNFARQSVGLLVGWSVNSVCKLIIYMYLPFAVYCGKFMVCLPFTVNTVYRSYFSWKPNKRQVSLLRNLFWETVSPIGKISLNFGSHGPPWGNWVPDSGNRVPSSGYRFPQLGNLVPLSRLTITLFFFLMGWSQKLQMISQHR